MRLRRVSESPPDASKTEGSTAMTDKPLTTAENLPAETIEAYRRDGFVRIKGVISKSEVEAFRQAALDLAQRMESLHKGRIFTQLVNVWRQDEAMRRLTLHPNVAAIAERLAGLSLRLWHDQILIKQPHNNAPTEFHQDQPYWPHADARQPISAWIALVDVPVERGCMTFIPGSFRRIDLAAQNLGDPRSLFSLWPELEWETRVTLPLEAGDCTFHHGRCAHMAGSNATDQPRVAHAVIFTDAETTYTGKRHVVTDPLQLQAGRGLDGELFPLVREFGRVA